MSLFINENAEPQTVFTESDKQALQETVQELRKLENLDENLIRITRRESKETRKRRVVARQAMLLAKQQNDSLYSKLVTHLEKVKELRQAIRRKYRSQAMKSVKR